MSSVSHHWKIDFLRHASPKSIPKQVLIILNQPFTFSLLRRLWESTCWRCCADGGANRLFDVVPTNLLDSYLPDLIKGDLDSLRSDVREYYTSKGVQVIKDDDQDSTDLMKCVVAVTEKEEKERECGCTHKSPDHQYDIIVLGGLAGRLDQTIHLLSFLHKLRKTRKKVYAVTDDNIGWVLDSGEHCIEIDHTILGLTCGLLPVGIDCSIISTSGLRWNLTDHPSSFDGLVSTSNHLVSEKDVWIKTTKPIWWTVELK
ncbi:hypothetical protein D9757_002752 [Collybiopsis confluens]|uniref:Thiamine pyrophosphokinase n=1 Tax=Collybiopsis confluens TaxID=2823264 RepID=A0A8H5MEE7_9AGAR|nr:hypothetical protein D9757_002752 [Collybiopsis confluens]